MGWSIFASLLMHGKRLLEPNLTWLIMFYNVLCTIMCFVPRALHWTYICCLTLLIFGNLILLLNFTLVICYQQQTLSCTGSHSGWCYSSWGQRHSKDIPAPLCRGRRDPKESRSASGKQPLWQSRGQFIIWIVSY